MNILMCSDTYTPQKNGVISMIIAERDALKKLGHTVYLITVGRQQAQDDDTLLRIRSIPALGVKAGQSFRIGLNVIEKRRIQKFLLGKEIDIVHTHTEFSLGWLGVKLARKLNVPVVHTYHTLWEYYKRVYFVGKLLSPFSLDKMYFRTFLKRIDLLITPSKKSQKYLTELLDTHNSIVVPNCIPMPPVKISDRSYLRKQYGWTDEDIVCIFAGRISEEKRVFQLYRAFRYAVKECKNLKMVFVGNGMSLSTLQTWSLEDNLQEYIQFLGFRPLEEVQLLNSLCDVTVTASLSENSSISVLEGVAAGNAVVARADDSFHNVIRHKKNALLARDDIELAELLIEIAKNSQLRSMLRENNRKLASKLLPSHHAKLLMKVYKKALDTYRTVSAHSDS